MTDAEFQAELDKREAEKKAATQTADGTQQLDKAKREVVAAVVATAKANMQHRANTTTKVDVQNDIAGTEDINRAVEAINNVAVLMLSQNQQQPSINVDLGKGFNDLSTTLTTILSAVQDDSKEDANVQAITKQIDGFLKQLKTLQIAPDPDVKKSLANIEKVLSKLDVKPTVNIPTPKVTVQGKEVDLSPLVGLLEKINTTLDMLPKEKNDDSEVVAGLSAVQNAITSLRFPVANYVLPFKDVNGKDVQVQLDSSGNVPISGGAGGGNVTIVSPIGAITSSASVSVTPATDANVSKETGGNLATIATNTGNSATSANQTNGSQQTKLTDGTNITNILKSDGTAAGQNSQLIAGTGMTTGTLTLNSGAPATAWFDMLNYPWISVEILTNTTPATLTFQTSGDASQTNVRSTTLTDSQATITNAAVIAVASTGSTNGTFYGPRTGRYFRVSSNNGAGSTTLVITFYTTAPAQQAVIANVNSLSSTGSAVPANAFYQGMIARSSAPTAATNGNLVGALGSTMGALISQPALLNSAVAVSASLTVVKAAAGFLSGVLVTTAGTAQAMTIYDNASAASGTVIGVIPSSATAGQYYPFSMPATNGITCSGSSNNPAVTVAYS